MLNISLGIPQQHDRLTIYPLIARDAPELPFHLMADALDRGVLRISEVDSGVVGELLAINSGPTPILILDGEQLIGAKQNRTTNRSIILPAGSETRLPVSCMEQGRWHDESTHFKPSRHGSPSEVRRKAREVEVRHADTAMGAPPEVLSTAQGAVWGAIQEKLAQFGDSSPTSNLEQLYTRLEQDLTSDAAAFPAVETQVGLLAFVADVPLGLDLIGSRSLYAKLHERLLKGYLMDALSSPARRGIIGPEAPQRYLDSVAAARRIPTRTVGMGTYAVVSGLVIGGELTAYDSVVHLSAFPVGTTAAGGSTPGGRYDAPIQPPSRRRRGG
jgi:hypothetical protein